MERIEGLSIELDLDSTRLDRGLKGAKSNLRSVNSEMKANMSAFDRGDRSVGKYETRLQGLNKKLDAQKRATSEALKEYEKMVDEHGEGSEQAEKAAREYNNQAAALNNLERYVGDATKELEEMRKEQEFQESSWGKMTSSLNDFSGKMNSLGDGFINTGRTLTKNVTTPMMAFGGIAVAAADKVEKAYRDIRVGTGATGDDLESLENSFDNVFANVPDDAEQVAGSLANLNTYTGATDDVLDGLSRTVLDVSRLLGEDAVSNSESFGKAMQQWQRPAKDGGDMLDYLYSVTQDYGVGLGEITGHLSTYGSVLNNAGFEMEQAAELMASLESNGISVSRVMPGLNSAFRNWAAEGKDVQKELENVISSMQDAESNQEALTIATEAFGAEGAQRLTTAIRNGAIPAFEDLGSGAEDAKGSIQETTVETKTIGEEFAELKNQAMLELQPVGEIFIELAREKLPPLIESVQEAVEWFKNLSPEAQDNALKIAGLAAVAGPASLALGGIFKVTGSVAGGLASVTEAIGRKGGKGAAGAIGLLTKGGVVGLAVAGIGALGYAIYDAVKETDDFKEATTDTAKSLSDQANDLQENVDTFDRLAGKAKISNEQLADLHELNKKISESSSPGEIQALQEQYDELAKNSGLSKDELNELFTANDNIIAQAPDVQTAVSETGTQFVENTEAVNEYIQSLYDMSRETLNLERKKNLENEKKIIQDIDDLTKERNAAQEEYNQFLDYQKWDYDELLQKAGDLEEKSRERGLSEEEITEIKKEQQTVTDAMKALEDETGEALQEQINKRDEEIEKINESLATEEEKKEQIQAFNDEYANILLKQVGINEEGEKGLVQLDESIEKNKEKLAELDKEKEAKGYLTQEEEDRKNKLIESIASQVEIKDHLYDEMGLYTDLNSLIDGKLDALGEEGNKHKTNLGMLEDINVEEGNILDQIQNKNEKLAEERSNLIENLKQQGATTDEINDQVSEIDNKISNNDSVLEQVLRETGLWNEVKDKIDMGSDAISGQGYGIDSNNDKTRTGIGLEQDRTAEAATDVDKFVDAQDGGTVRAIELAAMGSVIKPVNARDTNGTIPEINRMASDPVSKTINFVAKGLGSLKFWAKGTPEQGHPGGHAIIGEKGRELVQLPNGSSFLSPGSDTFIPNMPKGTHVIPNHKTESILKGTSYYADGTDGWENLTNGASSRSSEFMTRLALFNRNQQQEVVVSGGRSTKHLEQMINLLSEQVEDSKEMIMLLAKLVAKDIRLEANGRELAKLVNEENALDSALNMFK